MKHIENTHQELFEKVQRLHLWGCLTNWDTVASSDWITTLVEMEEAARAARSLERRTKVAKLEYHHPPISDYNWSIRAHIDREGIENCFTLNFIEQAENLIFIGGVGVGKTMIATNIIRCAIAKGYTALFTTTLDLLNNLASQETGRALEKKLNFYSNPDILVIDELGYLGCTSEQADLLFQLIARRYQKKPIIITANKPFAEWNTVFPDATCVVAMVDRLVHKASVFSITGKSYRLMEATVREKSKKAAAVQKATKVEGSDE